MKHSGDEPLIGTWDRDLFVTMISDTCNGLLVLPSSSSSSATSGDLTSVAPLMHIASIINDVVTLVDTHRLNVEVEEEHEFHLVATLSLFVLYRYSLSTLWRAYYRHACMHIACLCVLLS